MKKSLNFSMISTFVILFSFQRIASVVGGAVASIFEYGKLDPDNLFLNISVHHLIQMIISIIAIFVLYKKHNLQFNIRIAYSKKGAIYTMVFSILILLYVLSSHFIGYKMGLIKPYDYPLTPTNVIGTLGFQLFLSGPSEELLFRALPVTIFLSLFTSKDNDRKRDIIAIVLSSILFSLAHISITSAGISFDWFQLVYAFVLGVAYAVTYIKAKSIIYPMIMHSMSNVLMVGVGYLFMIQFTQ